MQKFISRGKLGKKAKRELDAQQRHVWGISPVSRKSKNIKAYDRKRSPQWPDDGNAEGAFLYQDKTAKT